MSVFESGSACTSRNVTGRSSVTGLATRSPLRYSRSNPSCSIRRPTVGSNAPSVSSASASANCVVAKQNVAHRDRFADMAGEPLHFALAGRSGCTRPRCDETSRTPARRQPDRRARRCESKPSYPSPRWSGPSTASPRLFQCVDDGVVERVAAVRRTADVVDLGALRLDDHRAAAWRSTNRNTASGIR